VKKANRKLIIASATFCLAIAAVLALRFMAGSFSPQEVWKAYRSFWESSVRGVALGAETIKGGFDITNALIPRDEILSGGPSKDAIPALTDPKAISADVADYLRPTDMVVGVSFGDEARAYPLRILVWHENVNDTVGGVPIAVSYCPLCRSALAFDRRVGGTTRKFGISGLLWNSNVLLYDRQEDDSQESLWSQVHMRAVTGPAAREGLRLKLLPSQLTSWREWLERHPDTNALSKRTGHLRNYNVSPYSQYFSNDRLMFPARQLKRRPERFLNKEPMIVVSVGDKWKAYAVRDIAAVAGESGSIEDVVGGKRLRLTYSKDSESVRAELIENGLEVPAAYMFWFALSSMLPEFDLYTPPEAKATNSAN
jgi:hypothetical protein